MMGCFIGVGSRRRRTSSDGQECAVRANGINGFSAKVKGVALLVTVIVALLMLATPMRAQAALSPRKLLRILLRNSATVT